MNDLWKRNQEVLMVVHLTLGALNSNPEPSISWAIEPGPTWQRPEDHSKQLIIDF